MLSRACLATIVLSLASTSVAVAADPKGPTYTDPEKAGLEFELQGEYLGTIESDDGPKKLGAQIIALGDGKFRGIGFDGGLPGQGWSKGDEKHVHEGQLDGGVLRFQTDDAVVEVQDGKVTVVSDGRKVGELQKVERKSPTLGAQPPAGAVVLFDGGSVEAFENGQLVDGKWLGATNAETKQKFGDHKLHIEFRTPFMPAARGQGRGNSGVYVHGRYEVQVLDSFGLEGKDNECGGIYSISEPDVNMCLPPLAWQTYDIDFTAPRYDDDGKKTENGRITIRHNGVVIHDDIELPKHTPGRHAEGPSDGGLFLQNHGNPVVFRNIWVVEKDAE